MTRNGCPGCRTGTFPFWNQEAAIRMRLRALLCPVLVTQGQLNIFDRFNARRVRLALPEHHETLSAYAAMHFRIAVCTLT
jgi:hypothetical protein